MNEILNRLKDLRYIRIPRRYKTYKNGSELYWGFVQRSYWNFKKRVDYSGYHWYVITFKDGRKELAYFRVCKWVLPRQGRLCRGLIPRHWAITQYERVKDIRLAF